MNESSTWYIHTIKPKDQTAINAVNKEKAEALAAQETAEKLLGN